jgi:hypothetical protein
MRTYFIHYHTDRVHEIEIEAGNLQHAVDIVISAFAPIHAILAIMEKVEDRRGVDS